MSNSLMIAGNTGLLLEDEYEAVLRNVKLMITSGTLPGRYKNPEQAIIAYQYGKELKLPFMTAMSEIFVVDGTPGCSAKIMLGIIKRDVPEAKIVIIKNDDTGCWLTGWRPGDDEPTPFSFTIEEAKRWGLVNKKNWVKDPKGMCRNRASSMMGRFMFMDVLGGFGYTVDELEEASVTFNAKKLSKPKGMPKKGDTPTEEVTDVEAEEVDVTHEKYNVTVINGLTKELKGTDQQDLAELIYDTFREKNAEDQETLAKGYEIFEKRKQEIGGEDAKD